MKDVLLCEVRQNVERAFKLTATWKEEGVRQEIFPSSVPDQLKKNVWTEIRARTIERDRHHCQDCGKDLSHLPHWFTEVHHIIPRIRGGTDHPANLKTLCVPCHRMYTNDILFENIEGLKEVNDAGKVRRQRGLQSLLDYLPEKL